MTTDELSRFINQASRRTQPVFDCLKELDYDMRKAVAMGYLLGVKDGYEVAEAVAAGRCRPPGKPPGKPPGC